MIPEAWRGLDPTQWRSPIFVIGGTDTGKTTFVRHIVRRLSGHCDPVAFIDLDVGQNTLGMPTTVGLTMGRARAGDDGGREGSVFPPAGQAWRCFVGAISPVGHEARLLSTVYRLKLVAHKAGAGVVVIDTTGFIDAGYGAAALKWAKIELLRPCTVVALARGDELAPIVAPLRRWPGVDLVELPASDTVRIRSREARRAYRTACYREAFVGKRSIPIAYDHIAVFNPQGWRRGQLFALEDRGGFVLQMGVVVRLGEGKVWAITSEGQPASGAVALRGGDVMVDLVTYEDSVISWERSCPRDAASPQGPESIL